MLIAHIRRDGGTQIREALDEDTVTDYADLYRAAKSESPMPDVEVFFDGADHWLVDGFHRVEGALRAKKDRIMAAIKPGTQSQAILAACAANQKHGLRRSNATKRRQVETALRHPESAGWSDRAIAKHCGVDHGTVAAVKAELRSAATEEGQQVAAREVAKSPPRVPKEPGLSGKNSGDEGACTQSTGEPSRVTPSAAPAPGEPADLQADFDMDLLGFELDDEQINAWSFLEGSLSNADNHLRQAQAELASLLGKRGQDSDKIQALRQAVHDVAARIRKTAKPVTVCLYCKDPSGAAGRRSQCNGCRGLGYLVEEQMGAVPRELLAKGDAAKVIDQERGGFVDVHKNGGAPTVAPEPKCKDCGGSQCGAVCRYTSRGNMRPVGTVGRAKRLQIQDGEGRDLVVERDEAEPTDTW